MIEELVWSWIRCEMKAEAHFCPRIISIKDLLVLLFQLTLDLHSAYPFSTPEIFRVFGLAAFRFLPLSSG